MYNCYLEASRTQNEFYIERTQMNFTLNSTPSILLSPEKNKNISTDVRCVCMCLSLSCMDSSRCKKGGTWNIERSHQEEQKANPANCFSWWNKSRPCLKQMCVLIILSRGYLRLYLYYNTLYDFRSESSTQSCPGTKLRMYI